VLAAVGTASLIAGMVIAIPAQSASATSGVQPTFTNTTQPLIDLGSVDMASIAGVTNPGGPTSTPDLSSPTPLGKLQANGTTGGVISHGSFSIQKGNVNGETGFAGISGAQQRSVNTFNLEPPDQAVCAGPDASGNPIVFEFVNTALAAWTTSGTPMQAVTPASALFKQLPVTGRITHELSDPRCYYDSSTQRWFFTMFDVQLVTGGPNTQFIAVSQTSDPLGNYEVFAFDTTDATNPNCPCFGDFDMIGADANGFYITTNGFSNVGPGYEGANIYAVSKQGLEAAASGTGRIPIMQRYLVTSDAFGPGPYHISPASTPQGGTYSNNTEFFVESNSNLFADNHLLVYSLTGTDALATGGAPTLSSDYVPTEEYTVPPNATQENGPIPLGNARGATTVSPLQSDFDAVQQVTDTGGELYAELSTGIGATGTNVGAAWFSFNASSDGTTASASLDKNGYVANGANLLYPDIITDANGNGYMDFTLTGDNNFPTPAYVKFSAAAGPISTIHTATEGLLPEDGFSCYAGSANIPCRWGDYSGGQAFNGRIYMGAEYIGNAPRFGTMIVNWQDWIWSAPS
jgi:hypothetical protein